MHGHKTHTRTKTHQSAMWSIAFCVVLRTETGMSPPDTNALVRTPPCQTPTARRGSTAAAAATTEAASTEAATATKQKQKHNRSSSIVSSAAAEAAAISSIERQQGTLSRSTRPRRPACAVVWCGRSLHTNTARTFTKRNNTGRELARSTIGTTVRTRVLSTTQCTTQYHMGRILYLARGTVACTQYPTAYNTIEYWSDTRPYWYLASGTMRRPLEPHNVPHNTIQ